MYALTFVAFYYEPRNWLQAFVQNASVHRRYEIYELPNNLVPITDSNKCVLTYFIKMENGWKMVQWQQTVASCVIIKIIY